MATVEPVEGAVGPQQRVLDEVLRGVDLPATSERGAVFPRGTAATAPRVGSGDIILEVAVGRGRRKCTTHRDARLRL